jgi:hypothetical protein
MAGRLFEKGQKMLHGFWTLSTQVLKPAQFSIVLIGHSASPFAIG